jgi:hypothetical protein
VISPSIGAGGAFVPDTIERNGFGFLWDAATVLIDLFGEEIDGRRSDLLGLLIGTTDLPFFRGPV